MANKLSRSEIESLLAAVRADSAVLPKSDESIDQNVDFDSFDRNAIAGSFFNELMRHTVDGLVRAAGLALTVDSVELLDQPVAEPSVASVILQLADDGGDTWTLRLSPDLVLPMAATTLAAPLEDYVDRTEQRLSFIERQLLEPVFYQTIHHLNEQRFLDNSLSIHDVRIMDESTPDESRRTVEPDLVAMCTVHGNGAPFAGTLEFQVPAVVLGRQSYERPQISTDESTLELTVVLMETEITSAEVAELAVGDVLMTEIASTSLLSATIDGLPAFRGTMGISQGRKALRVTEKVTVPA